jgi:hypothetical protein
MSVFLGVFLVFFTFVILMSVGVIMGRSPIKGSCGGVGKALGEPDYSCDICGGDEAKCEESKLEGISVQATDLAIDVSKK